MMPLIIQIRQGYPDDTLELVDIHNRPIPHPVVGPRSRIRWQPIGVSHVVIKKILEKDGFPRIFCGEPSSIGVGSPNWEVKLIDTTSPDIIRSEYYIAWNFDFDPPGMPPRIFDPLMSINPSLPPSLRKNKFFKINFPLFALIAAAIASVVIWKWSEEDND